MDIRDVIGKRRLLEIVGALAALIVASATGCGGSDTSQTGGTAGSGAGGGSGGGGSSGGGGAAGEEAPDYALAFPQDRVPRLDITISSAEWQAMVDDMTGMLGAFGTGQLGGGGGGGGGGGPLPQEFYDACIGLTAGDPCAVSFMGMDVSGNCTADQSGALMCQPSGFPGGGGGGFPGGGGGSGGGFPGGGGGGGGGGGPPGGGLPGGGDNVDLLPHTPTYVECEVATEDRKWSHVGIRFKGNSSLATPWMSGVWKMPLRLTFDEFEDTYPETKDQRFYGFKALSLSNGSADPSLLRDKIGTEVFADAGIPAPATAFYRVFIDHGEGSTYFGLYTGIEIPSDDSFLDTHFAGHKGNLYKPDGTGARWETFDADTLGKENHTSAADFSDAQALFDALHADRSDAAAWRAGLEAHLDVAGFLHWLALNTVIQDWDTYGRMAHNYYLYANPKDGGRFAWIPWDHSYAFNAAVNPLSLEMSEVTDKWPLIRFLLDDPTYKEAYRTAVAQAASKEYLPVTTGARFQAAHDLIAPYVTGAEGEIPGYTFITSDTSFDDGLAALLIHASNRQSEVATFLAK